MCPRPSWQANLEEFLSALHQRLDDIELVGIEMEKESSSQNRRSLHGHNFDLARRMGISKEEVSHQPVGEAEAEGHTNANANAAPEPSMAAEPAHHPPPARPDSAGPVSLEPASLT